MVLWLRQGLFQIDFMLTKAPLHSQHSHVIMLFLPSCVKRVTSLVIISKLKHILTVQDIKFSFSNFFTTILNSIKPPTKDTKPK